MLNRTKTGEWALPQNVHSVFDETNSVHLAHFQKFSSKASGSLGASQPAEAVVRVALDWPGGVKCVSVPDELSMEALTLFANDQKMLVELSCSTTLVPACNPALFEKIMGTSEGNRTVVFIVCGGFKVSVSEANEYQEMLNSEPGGNGEAWSVKLDDGGLFTFDKAI